MKTADELLTMAWLTLTIYPARESTELVRQQIKEYLDAPKPEPKKPMTEEEINEEWSTVIEPVEFGDFLAGIRCAERHHNIGEKE